MTLADFVTIARYANADWPVVLRRASVPLTIVMLLGILLLAREPFRVSANGHRITVGLTGLAMLAVLYLSSMTHFRPGLRSLLPVVAEAVSVTIVLMVLVAPLMWLEMHALRAVPAIETIALDATLVLVTTRTLFVFAGVERSESSLVLSWNATSGRNFFPALIVSTTWFATMRFLHWGDEQLVRFNVLGTSLGEALGQLLMNLVWLWFFLIVYRMMEHIIVDEGP